MKKGILLFWPSFMIAMIATAVFFSIFDPAELKLHGNALFSDKLSAYSLFFLASWAFGALNTSIVLLLEKTAREINGFTPPPAIAPDEDAPLP
ncbi:hypothetical protein DK842_19220 [Chromobacterium phragmitis]|uniref:Uncharacterized protein n=1 Tax=Chromobacterium phragmitis TaxID=2202141 RepID=A0A344UD72_9NEIS|nr:hypothetical protein [Chromobacterium phragmitis]AXE31838.1 hypothetical protein DK842_19220 [Chromobacterium phragmitis]AXE33220.1 hypothetical protein DK843_02150 [Chromobacterium phragmitis]